MRKQEIPLYCLSVSYRNAPLELRQRLAFSNADQEALLRKMCGEGNASGAVLAVTCNRTELYYAGMRTQLDFAERLLAAAADTEVSELRAQLRTFCGQEALAHLFRVTSGLESMVVGEDEILRQIREAYRVSCEIRCADYWIHTAFQKAAACAKRIKTETCLSKTSVSVASLSAKEIQHFITENHISEAQVLLIGVSGETGSLVAKNLAGADVHIYATRRRRQPMLQAPYITQIDYEKRYDYLAGADVVVSATKSPHYVLTLHDGAAAMQTAKPRLFVDLAVPRDIDPALVKTAGASLLTIDDFETAAAVHNEQKKDGVVQAEEILSEELCEAGKEFQFHSFLGETPRAKERLGAMQGDTLLYEMKKAADETEWSVVLSLLERIE